MKTKHKTDKARAENMEKLKLCYGELGKDTQKLLKREMKMYLKGDVTDEELKRLFEVNNTKIEMDIFNFMDKEI